MKREINDFSKHFFCLVNLCESQSVAETHRKNVTLSASLREMERATEGGKGGTEREREIWKIKAANFLQRKLKD